MNNTFFSIAATTSIIINNSDWESTTSSAVGQGPGEGPEEIQNTVLEAIPFVENGLDGGWYGRVGTSAILLFGTFGNVMTILILRRLQSGWSAMNVYLTCLAMSDMAMLYSGTLPVWTRKVFRWDLYASHVVVCKVGVWVMNTSASLSAWILVALTMQRAASVVSPHRVNLICTRTKSLIVIAAITAICSLLYGHTLFGYELVTVAESAVRCTFGQAAYQRFWVTVWVRLDMFIYSLLPCAALICSNSVLGWKLAAAVKDARDKLATAPTIAGKQATGSREKKASSATVTIILVSTAFVVLTIPLMAYNSFFQDYAAEDAESRAFHYFLYEFFFVVGLSNFAWNFYLYCLTGSRFRREFVRIVSGWWCCCCGEGSGSTAASGASRDVSEGSRTRSTHGESKDDF